MLPRLDAAESLSAAQRTGVGSGTLSAADSRRITKGWLDAINGGAQQAGPQRRASAREIRAFAAKAGMGYVRTRKAPKPESE
jgi:hypothetical protein